MARLRAELPFCEGYAMRPSQRQIRVSRCTAYAAVPIFFPFAPSLQLLVLIELPFPGTLTSLI